MTLRQFLAATFSGRKYDKMCREGLRQLWTRVADDGCVMTSPLIGQLEGDGWNVYVQIGERGEDFVGITLAEAIEVALRKTEAWIA